MAQVKKSEVQNSILEAAFSLFSQKGYQSTSMPDIAALAGITAGNIYRYYKSKFELFYGVLEPWLESQLDDLEHEISDCTIASEKLRKILNFMWIDLPRAGNKFELNLMEALATKKPDETYSRDLLLQSERRVTNLLEQCLPDHVKDIFPSADLSHLIFMCHDGFVLNVRLIDERDKINDQIERLINLCFAPTGKTNSLTAS